MINADDYTFSEFWESQFKQYSLNESDYSDYVSFRCAFDSVMLAYDRYIDAYFDKPFSMWLRQNFADANYGVSVELYDELSKQMIEEAWERKFDD